MKLKSSSKHHCYSRIVLCAFSAQSGNYNIFPNSGTARLYSIACSSKNKSSNCLDLDRHVPVQRVCSRSFRRCTHWGVSNGHSLPIRPWSQTAKPCPTNEAVPLVCVRSLMWIVKIQTAML